MCASYSYSETTATNDLLAAYENKRNWRHLILPRLVWTWKSDVNVRYALWTVSWQVLQRWAIQALSLRKAAMANSVELKESKLGWVVHLLSSASSIFLLRALK